MSYLLLIWSNKVAMIYLTIMFIFIFLVSTFIILEHNIDNLWFFIFLITGEMLIIGGIIHSYNQMKKEKTKQKSND